jgi:hypothetical protein
VERTEMADFELVAVHLLPQRYRHRDHYSPCDCKIEAAIRSITFSGRRSAAWRTPVILPRLAHCRFNHGVKFGLTTFNIKLIFKVNGCLTISPTPAASIKAAKETAYYKETDDDPTKQDYIWDKPAAECCACGWNGFCIGSSGRE